MPILSSSADRDTIFPSVERFLADSHLSVASKDTERPWGGFYVIDEAQTQDFIEQFFPEEDTEKLGTGKLSPKILVVAPGKRLSWQCHKRRAELWRIVEGDVGVVQSPTDEEQPVETMHPGEIIRLAQGTRHRLIGQKDWGIVAEIWQHTDPSHPSDEEDIVRLQDDFGRG